MPSSLSQARDDLLKLVFGVWPDGAKLFVDGKPVTERPDPSAPWGEVIIKHVASHLMSLGGKYESSGTVTVTVYDPSQDGAEVTAKLVRLAFEKYRTASGVWFPETRITRIGPDGAWDHWNVIGVFRWTEFR